MASRRIDVAAERFPGWIGSFGERHGGGLTAEPGCGRRCLPRGRRCSASCEVPFPPFTPAAGLAPEALARRRRRPTPAQTARSACCWSGSAGTRPASSPARNRSSRHPRSAAGSCTDAARRAGSPSAASPGAGRTRRTRHSPPPPTPPPRCSAGTASTRSCWAATAGRWLACGPIRRLAGYFEQAAGPFLTVPDPRLTVLRDTPRLFRAIRIMLTEPEPAEIARPG